MNEYLKFFDTIRFYAPCNIFRIFLFLIFLIQFWKRVKFSTNSVFSTIAVEPDWCIGRIGRYTGPNRLNYKCWFWIWIQPFLGCSRLNRSCIPLPDHGSSAWPVGKKTLVGRRQEGRVPVATGGSGVDGIYRPPLGSSESQIVNERLDPSWRRWAVSLARPHFLREFYISSER
jgi:hypothetical protein